MQLEGIGFRLEREEVENSAYANQEIPKSQIYQRETFNLNLQLYHVKNEERKIASRLYQLSGKK